MKIELIKELYFRELELKNQHDSRPTLHVAVLSILGGLLFFGYQRLRPLGGGLMVGFWVLFAPAVLSYAVALIQVLRANLGHLYERLPSPDVLYDYHVKLLEYHARNPEATGTPEEEFAEFLARHMVLATSRNTQSNLSRSSRHYSAMRALALTVVFAIASAVVVLLAESVERPPEPRATAQLAPAKGVEPMSDEEKPTQTTQPQGPPGKPEERPTEPSNVLFKGTQEPPKQKVVHLGQRERTQQDDQRKK